MGRARHRKRRIWWMVLLGFLGIAVYLFYTELRPVVIFGLREDFAHAVPYQSVPDGIEGIRAEDCGVCHQEIYEEWKSSIHAHAYEDPFFQAFWKKDKNIWICLNCHTPLENQQPELILEIPRNRVERAIKQPNPRYDAKFQKEGITCAVCHVRDGVILGPYGDSLAPHPTRYDPMFRTTEICYRCHQVPAGPFQFYRFGPCGTYPEFEGGHYYEAGYICQSCHMPEIRRPVAIGGPVREGRQHLWSGGHDPEQIRRAVTVQLRSEPAVPQTGTPVDFIFTITNSGAGHYIPTGDPDRYFTVELSVLDEEGKVVQEETHTIGRWIVWQPVIIEVYGNRLKPLEQREFRFRYTVPGSAQEAKNLKFRAVLRYHIMTEQTHQMLQRKYGLTADDPYVFIIDQREVGLLGPLSADDAAPAELGRRGYPAKGGSCDPRSSSRLGLG